MADVLATVGPAAERRLRARFALAGVSYPPERVHLLAFKAERRFELWASAGRGAKQVAVFPLLAGSGGPGPKLREGDYQIPEGRYRLVWLHPNSRYHLSMKLDYPNAFDREQARREGRTNLGGDIFIHGGDVSIGCLAVGDPAIEELFVLAARVGIERVTAIVAPWDLRHRPPPELEDLHLPWLPTLYAELSRSLAAFR
ncbi:MAG: L,D-transpeptidase family protein [Thermoanaerobaculia bacterium]|nr:MAG: L,D-transpeptidase family protein [Thermoanaerobaculia bacterium]